MKSINETVEKYIGEGDKWQDFKDKMFKAWFGKSKEQVRKDARELSDEELKFLAKRSWKKSGGAQQIQGQEIMRELKRRGLSRY